MDEDAAVVSDVAMSHGHSHVDQDVQALFMF